MKKKILALSLVSIMSVAALAGCGGSSKEASSAPAASASDSADKAEAEAGLTLAKDGVLTMATNAYFPPYEYYDGDTIVGIDADIAEAVADKLGLELKIEDMEFDSIIPAVNSGKVDFGAAGMTVTEERLESVDFTESYCTGVQSVIVKK